jgi:hypothetical protein
MREGAGVESLWGTLVLCMIAVEHKNDDLPLGAQLHLWEDDV